MQKSACIAVILTNVMGGYFLCSPSRPYIYICICFAVFFLWYFQFNTMSIMSISSPQRRCPQQSAHHRSLAYRKLKHICISIFVRKAEDAISLHPVSTSENIDAAVHLSSACGLKGRVPVVAGCCLVLGLYLFITMYETVTSKAWYNTAKTYAY